MHDDKPTAEVLPSWPVVVGLGLVTLLVAGMIGLDVHFAEEQARQTTDIIENAQQSIVLLNNIRFEAKRLAVARSEQEIVRLRQSLAKHSQQYDTVATYQGERDEWTRLQDMLGQLPLKDVENEAAAQRLDDAIDRSIDALVTINTAAGQGNLTAIWAAHRRAIWSDVIAGAVVLLIVAIISVWLLHVLAHQRRLVLRQVQLLDEKNAELEAFAGRAAHDLRSPMNPIRGYADLILEVPTLPEKVAAMAQKIRRAVDRMVRVVDDMLALSVSGRPPAGQAAISVVVERVLEEMGAELEGVEIVTKIAGSQVRCGEGTLAQILRNLIGNAIKFRSRSRALRIVIESRDVGAQVEIIVEDNGVGMDPASAKHVFEPFFRGSNEREIPGHGLGLAIVERVTRALGGGCEVTSVLDQSTRFTVRLPRV